MLEYTQSIFFHRLSSDHQNDHIEPFSRLSMLLIADKTNTNPVKSRFGQFHKCGSCSIKHTILSYIWYHLIEETYIATYMYEHFLKIFGSFYMGGHLEKCKLFCC